jgi:hypothetical protein
MTTPVAARLVTTYRARVEAVHAEVTRRLEALYGDSIDRSDIDASFARYIARAAPIVEAGQAAMASLAAAFLRSYSLARTGDLIEVASLEGIVGTTKKGAPLAEGMADFGAMVAGRVAEGASLDDALDFGRYLAVRFGDSALTDTADRTIDATAEATGRVTGWEGIVAPDACEPCHANEGDHDNADEIYRHPGCNCDRIPLIGDSAA